MKRIFISFIAALFFFTLGSLWWTWGTSPVDEKSKLEKIFVIGKGEGIRSIAKRLKEEGLIKDQIIFFVLVKRLGLEEQIQAGDFRLSPFMRAENVALELTHGTLDTWVTIPEGLRSEEIAEILKEKIPTYNNSWINHLSKKEGYLFPDTYLIPKDADIELVLSIFNTNFNNKLTQQMQDDLKKGGRTLEEALILASLIEREAKFEEDRPVVAGVLLNRLRLGMKLDVDATVQYALGTHEKDGWWKKKLTSQDLKFNSLYNTYLVPDLPPSPIANPGLSSIKASIYPKINSYLYYISDKEGYLHYAKTFEEHQKNIEKYL